MKACEKGWLVVWLVRSKVRSHTHQDQEICIRTHVVLLAQGFFLKELQENLHNLNFLWKSESEDISMTTPNKTAYSISLPFVFP